MGIKAIKLELIEWLSNLQDSETIEYLKFVKDSDSKENDWWHDLSDEVKAGIERGLADADAGRVVSHEEVKKKYGF
jgi:hypothetical protein